MQECTPPDGTDGLSRARELIGLLYGRWYTHFIRFFEAKTTKPQDAEDLAHDTFRDALIQFAKGNEPRGNPHPWLMGIAYHRLADFYARQAADTRQTVPMHALFELDDEGTLQPTTFTQIVPDEDNGTDVAVEVVRQVLAQLSPRERRAYVFRYELGLTGKQVERLGWSRSYYYRMVWEMKKHVRALLEKED